MQSVAVSRQIADIARGQHGLITREQLVEIRVSRHQIRGWTDSGRLERVLNGVFRLGGAPESREQTLSAAVLWAGSGALVSHRSAGELWNLDGVHAAKPEITMPARSVKRSTEVAVHTTRVRLTDRRTRHGLPTTTPERTLIDLAGVIRGEQLEIAFESARRGRQVTVESVERTLARSGSRGRKGSDAMQALLTTLANEPPAESALEVITATLLRASNVPRPQRQVEVVAFGASYRLDFAWPDRLVALECDGRKWHGTEHAFERDRHRWSAITSATGYRIVWATWRRVKREPDALVAQLRRLMGSEAQAPEPRVCSGGG
jgi:very-short-patch-repair endonuclease